MASENLRGLESIVGSNRQRQEEIIKATLGSLYTGEGIIIMGWVHGTHNTPF